LDTSERYYDSEKDAISEVQGELGTDAPRITPIGAEKQAEWAKQFCDLCKVEVNEELENLLRQPAWYPMFVDFLRSIHLRLASAWKRFHSRLVGDFVEGWCRDHKVDPALFFESQKLTNKLPVEGSRTAAPPARSLRDVLLGVIAKLDAGDLLDVRVPLRVVLEELRPDLLK
jgi:hypothetical protein